ncbi:MAG: hypothetical protein MJ138_05975, partial [Kiritimatiellae bacterium]|nr:hypothetical protein [Kiritimatiellia bacterium]
VEKKVEVPVEKVVEKIVEKKVEVPVEKVVEKIVEVESSALLAAKGALEQDLAEQRKRKDELEADLAEQNKRRGELENHLADQVRKTEAVQRLVEESERKAAELEKDLKESRRETLTLSDEIKRLPPNAQEAANTEAAMFVLMREEAADLERALEDEKADFERARKHWQERADRLIARRQEILKRMGTDAADMKKRALRANPVDPRTVQLQQELDALRLIQEKTARETSQRIRDLSQQLSLKTAEAERLNQQVSDAKVLQMQIQELREKLANRERQLLEQQREAADCRERDAAAQQVLLARLSALESSMPHTMPSREAQNAARFPPWMGLKK